MVCDCVTGYTCIAALFLYHARSVRVVVRVANRFMRFISSCVSVA